MKQAFSIVVFVCIISQIPLLLIYESYFINQSTTTTTNLTSLMVPFESMDMTSIYFCSIYTLRLRYELEFEQLQHFRLGQIHLSPDINQRSDENFFSSLPQLPYFYSLWKSSSLLPRLMTPCQHQVYIQLLRTFDYVCRRNNIEYIISHGTLLGSYRNHDILPYDDDADILINTKYYPDLARLSRLNNKTSWQIYLKSRRNIKFFFRQSPSAGGFQWNWPFIGVQFFTDDSTHIYLHRAIDKKLIYPLVLRPLGGLWLPGPRRIHQYLHGLQKKYFIKYSIDEKCMMKDYSHQHEKVLYKQRTINCEQLHNIYPYIKRTCEKDFCYEYFMLNNVTNFYTLKIPINR